MNLKDRFLDFWKTDLAYQDYTYDITIFEQLIYGFLGFLFGIIGFGVMAITVPIWCIPYMIYKSIKINKHK